MKPRAACGRDRTRTGRPARREASPLDRYRLVVLEPAEYQTALKKSFLR